MLLRDTDFEHGGDALRAHGIVGFGASPEDDVKPSPVCDCRQRSRWCGEEHRLHQFSVTWIQPERAGEGAQQAATGDEHDQRPCRGAYRGAEQAPDLRHRHLGRVRTRPAAVRGCGRRRVRRNAPAPDAACGGRRHRCAPTVAVRSHAFATVHHRAGTPAARRRARPGPPARPRR